MLKQSLLLTLPFLVSPALAMTPSQQTIVAPECLIRQYEGVYQTLASHPPLNLISISQEDIARLIDVKNNIKARCGGFIDVTEAWNHSNKKAAAFLNQYAESATSSLVSNHSAYTIQYEKEVKTLLPQINAETMWTNLTTLSNFPDRYANSAKGVETADWIKNYIQAIAKENNRDDVFVTFIKSGTRYQQPSVVAKIGNSSDAGIVIGAHMDTLDGSRSKKPGADDDGSGTVAVLEVARTLLSSGMHFKKPIYIILYAAEEEGLVGSGYVVSEFKSKNIPVGAVLQFDVIGYAPKNDLTMWVIDDYVNKDLTTYLVDLINTYVKRPVKHTKCGYACSDHASWFQKGYPASIACEAAYENTNPYIHSSSDTIDKVSLAHMTDYTKLATAFAVELAEPVA